MTNKQPHISIGLPVYNGEKFITEAIESILAQTFEDYELIISDNHSTDRTEEICRQYAAKNPSIRYYRQNQNRGAAWNFNHVFQLARGEYFKWAAADDVCEPNFLARCTEVLDRDPSVVLAYPKTIFTKADGQKWWEGKSVQKLGSEQVHERFRAVIADFWCLEVFGLMRKEALKKSSLIASYYGSDKLLLAQLSLLGRFEEIPEPLFFRRCHAEQSSRLSPQEREMWIDPQNAGQSKSLGNISSLRYFSAVWQAQLDWQDRTRCFLSLIDYLFAAKTWKKFFHKKAPTKVY